MSGRDGKPISRAWFRYPHCRPVVAFPVGHAERYPCSHEIHPAASPQPRARNHPPMSTDKPAEPMSPAAEKKAAMPAAKKGPKAKKPSKPGKKQAAGKRAAGKKPAAGDVNKAEEIRKLAQATKAGGSKPRPSVIVAELAKRGIKVAAAQVSQVLKKMGFRPLRKRRKKGGSEAGAAPGAGPKAAGRKAGTSKAGAVSVDELLTAKKAAAALGGTERALEAIQALKRLGG